MKVLVTGSRGLIGRHLVKLLRQRGFHIVEYDIGASPIQDIRSDKNLSRTLRGVDGVVHLAAVSRVLWGEQHPELTWDVNVNSFRKMLTSIGESHARPWVLFGSSREVYGQAASLPVSEDAPLDPLNVYARTKMVGEQLTEQAGELFGRAQICRFSNVYGCPKDYPDRVVPAFARAAAAGGSIRVEGRKNSFDFTHVNDVVLGIGVVVEALNAGESFPPVHFVSGKSTTLADLASLSSTHARSPVSVREGPSRSFDVASFYGDPSRARTLLDWQATTPLETGFVRLIDALAHESGPSAPSPLFES